MSVCACVSVCLSVCLYTCHFVCVCVCPYLSLYGFPISLHHTSLKEGRVCTYVAMKWDSNFTLSLQQGSGSVCVPANHLSNAWNYFKLAYLFGIPSLLYSMYV